MFNLQHSGRIFSFNFKKNNQQECSVRIERLETNSNDTVLAEVTENDNKQNTFNKTEENQSKIVCLPTNRYRTRSSITRAESQENNLQISQAKKPYVPRPKPAFIEYKGKVDYFTEFHDIAFASDSLL